MRTVRPAGESRGGKGSDRGGGRGSWGGKGGRGSKGGRDGKGDGSDRPWVAAPWTPPVGSGPPATACHAARLGPVEQLVLRGDGLTTTSLEILTGHEVSVRVRRHWRLPLPAQEDTSTSAFDCYAEFSADTLGSYVSVGYLQLGCAAGDDLLIREVLLCGDTGVVYGTASVFAVLDRLPPDVAHRLATTGAPIGKLLVRAGVQVRRELRQWGLFRAGDFAAHLGPGVNADTRVPGRTYHMRDMATDKLITQITEWFAPWVFEAVNRTSGNGPSESRLARPGK